MIGGLVGCIPPRGPEGGRQHGSHGRGGKDDWMEGWKLFYTRLRSLVEDEKSATSPKDGHKREKWYLYCLLGNGSAAPI